MSAAGKPEIPLALSVACEEALLEIAVRNGADAGVHRRRQRGPTDGIVRAMVSAGFVRKTESRRDRKRVGHELTEAGSKLIKRIVNGRHREEHGRPLAEWDPRRDTNSPRPEEFADYAVLSAEAKSDYGSVHYHTDGKLMLLGPHPDPKRQVKGSRTIDAARVADPMLWHATRVEPIGYLFDMTGAIVAFSLEGVYLPGSAYETIVARAGGEAQWYALRATAEMLGTDEDHHTASAIRCDAGGVTGIAWSTLYKFDRRTPAGIRRLLDAAGGRAAEERKARSTTPA